MKPKHIKHKREKEVRRIWKRRAQIYKEIKDLGFIVLKKPVRHGWFKEIVITRRVERYKNEAAILEIYDKIEKCFWGKTKEDAQKQWLNQVSKYLIYKDLPTISKKQFNKLSLKAQYMCTPFVFKNEQKKIRLRFYVRIPKGAYRVKYTRAYVTHAKRIDPKLESELKLLEQQLLKKGYYQINQKLCRWKNYWDVAEQRKEKLKVNRKLKQLKRFSIDEIVNENISWEIN